MKPFSRHGLTLALVLVGFPALGAGKEVEPGLRRLDGGRLTANEAGAIVTQAMQAAHVTGLAVAVFNANQPAYVQAYGWRDKEKQLPFDVNTVTYGASLTKAVFATLVMQLVQEGKLDLDKSIADYLPKPLPAYEKYADLEIGRASCRERV